MSAIAADAAATAEQRAFWLRRLHSLTGVMPLGAFLVVHLWTNAYALRGRTAYMAAADELRRLPLVLALEVLGIYLPLAFHAGYGVVIALREQPDVTRYPRGRNWLYVAQRASSFVVLAFVLWHLWEYRLQVAFFGMRHAALYDALAANLSSTRAGVPWRALGYLVGTSASVFHFANGLWGFAATWGIAVTRPAQRRVALACTALGVGLFVLGLATIVHFSTGAAPLLSAPEQPGGAPVREVLKIDCPPVAKP